MRSPGVSMHGPSEVKLRRIVAQVSKLWLPLERATHIVASGPPLFSFLRIWILQSATPPSGRTFTDTATPPHGLIVQ